MTTAAASGIKRYVAVYFALLALWHCSSSLVIRAKGGSWSCAF